MENSNVKNIEIPSSYTIQVSTKNDYFTMEQSDWEEIKEFSKNIVISENKIDWFSLLGGIAINSFICMLIAFFNRKSYILPTDFYVHLSVLVISLIVVIIILKCGKRSSIIAESNIYHKNLLNKLERCEIKDSALKEKQ